MSRLFRFLGRLILALGLVVVVAVATVYFASEAKLKKKYSVKVQPVNIPTDAASIARGQHIARTRGCAECHGVRFGGNRIVDDFPMGRIYGSNLTTGPGSKIANYTNEDWVRAIRHGITPSGRSLIVMPSGEYAHFTADDLGCVIAYLKSLPPVDRESVRLDLGPVARVLIAMDKIKPAAEEVNHTRPIVASVKPGPTPEYGRYLSFGCMGCHGSNFSGGKIEIGPPDWPHAANLTTHAASRLPKWSEGDFVNALRTARRPDGTEINPVMPRTFGQMHDDELKALWAYFKTLPPIATGAR